MTDAQLMFEYMMEYSELYLKVYGSECHNKNKFEDGFYNFRLHEAQLEARKKHPRLYMRLIEVVEKINKLKQEPEK